MATYYVRTDGNNANSGTGSLATQAWATVAYALGSTSAGGAGLVSGDIVYIAPGVYRGAITIGMASATSDIQIIGDTLGSQFANIPAGEVILTVAASDNVLSGTTLVSATSKNYLNWSNILFDGGQASWNINLSGCQNWTFTKCTFSCATTQAYTTSNIQGVYAANVPANMTFDRCHVFFGGLLTTNTSYNASTNINIIIKDVFCIGPLIRQNGSNVTGISIYNCTVINNGTGAILAGTSVSGAMTVRNCVLIANNALEGGSTVISEDFNRIYSQSPRSGPTPGANSFVGYHALETLNRPLNQLAFSYFGSTSNAGANFNSGTATGAPTFDLFTSNWTGASPDRGAISWTAVSQITNYTTNYAPSERNASTITIAPGSTSKSIELYLGATGLTASTTSLAARYNRTRTVSVSIPLVARTIAQPWISGGFAEVDPVGMPGLYRLDVPDEALAIGVDDVTITVRGAAGSNGAVITINLKAVESSLISMGPYKVIADGLGADQPLDIMQGVQAPVSVQVVDVNENGIDITGATVQAKVYNSAGTLVGTYTCTPTYAADGRCTFLLTTDVTNVAGVYSVTITRAVGGNVVVFGPLKVMVRAN